MFTGIIEKIGNVVSPCGRTGGRLIVSPTENWCDLVVGESIAVDGACLSVTAFNEHEISFDVIHETALISSIGELQSDAVVNLERALRVGDRMGGHYVLGHIDCIGKVIFFQTKGVETELRISFSDRFASFVVPKGSIAVNGISLTLSEHIGADFISVYLIPLTLEQTNLKSLRPGSNVNLEFDYFGKWALNHKKEQAEDLRAIIEKAGFTEEGLWKL